jgi:hypothetical protein
LARPGTAGHGKARHGGARQGLARQGFFNHLNRRNYYEKHRSRSYRYQSFIAASIPDGGFRAAIHGQKPETKE